jgi:ProP effector
MATLTLRPTTAQPSKGPPGMSPEGARRARRRAVKAFRSLLAEQYPSTFPGVGGAPRAPLKLGIDKDLRVNHPQISSRTLGWTLAQFTGRPDYLALLVVGAARIDLDGRPNGIVSEVEARHAAARLRKRRPDGAAP